MKTRRPKWKEVFRDEFQASDFSSFADNMSGWAKDVTAEAPKEEEGDMYRIIIMRRKARKEK